MNHVDLLWGIEHVQCEWTEMAPPVKTNERGQRDSATVVEMEDAHGVAWPPPRDAGTNLDLAPLALRGAEAGFGFISSQTAAAPRPR